MQPFRLEAEMLEPVETLLPTHLNLPTPPYRKLLRQPSVGNVVPDVLIGISCRDVPVAPRRRSTLVQAHILALLETGGPLPTKDVMRRLYLRKSVADTALAHLRRIGSVIEQDQGKWAVAEHASTRHLEITAVEIKLRRWREALKQALNYLAFSDRAFVVLDGAQIKPTAEISEAFQQAGVGLLLLHGSIVHQEVSAVQSSPATCRLRVHAADKLFPSA